TVACGRDRVHSGQPRTTSRDLRLHLCPQECLDPLATSLQFLASWRIAVREHFQEPYAAQGKAGAKVFATAVAENKFGATSADIQKQQWISRQRCIGRHPCKNQISLLR